MSSTAPANIESPVVELDHADPAAIIAASHDLWRDLAGDQTQADDQALLRASALTFVAVLSSTDELQQVLPVLSQLTESHPARVVAIVPDVALEPGKVKTRLYMACSLGVHGRRTCGERIGLMAHPDRLSDLRQTLAGLFVEDLPRFVWWSSTRFVQTRLFSDLRRVVERMIVDSKRLEPPSFTPADLEKVVAGIRHATISDLNWGRITKWRDVTAQVFDMPQRMQMLQETARIDISAALMTDGKYPFSPLLYAGWLCERLGWRVEGGEVPDGAEEELLEGQVALRRADGKLLTLRFVRVNREGNDGRIVKVHFASAPPARNITEIERSFEMKYATLREVCEGNETMKKCIPMEPETLVNLMIREVNYSRRDAGYERAMPIAAQLWKAIGR